MKKHWLSKRKPLSRLLALSTAVALLAASASLSVGVSAAKDSDPYAGEVTKTVLFAKGDGTEGSLVYPENFNGKLFSSSNEGKDNNYLIRPEAATDLSGCGAVTFQLALDNQAAYEGWKSHLALHIKDSAGKYFTWPMPIDLAEGDNTVTLDLRLAAKSVDLSAIVQLGVQSFGDLQNSPKTDENTGWDGGQLDLKMSITDIFGCEVQEDHPGAYISEGFYRFWGPQCDNLDWGGTEVVFDSPANITNASALEFDFFVSDLEGLKALQYGDGSFSAFHLRLTSGNNAWAVIDFTDKITKSGWNHVSVPLSYVNGGRGDENSEFNSADVVKMKYIMEPVFENCTPDKNYAFGLLNLSMVNGLGAVTPGGDSGPYVKRVTKEVLYAKGDGTDTVYNVNPGMSADPHKTFTPIGVGDMWRNNYFIQPGAKNFTGCEALTFDFEVSDLAAYDEWKGHMLFCIQADKWYYWPMPAEVRQGKNQVTLDLRLAAKNGLNLSSVSLIGISTFNDLMSEAFPSAAYGSSDFNDAAGIGWIGATQDLTISMTDVYGCKVEWLPAGQRLHDGFYRYWGPKAYNLDFVNTSVKLDAPVDLSQTEALEFDFFVSDLEGLKAIDYESASFASFYLRLFSGEAHGTIDFGSQITKSGWNHVRVPLSYIMTEGNFVASQNSVDKYAFYMEPLFNNCTPDTNYTFALLNLSIPKEESGSGDYGPAVTGGDSGPYVTQAAKTLLVASGDGSTADYGVERTFSSKQGGHRNNYLVRPAEATDLSACDAVTFTLNLSDQAAIDEWQSHVALHIKDGAGKYFVWPMPTGLKAGANEVTLDLRLAAKSGVALDNVTELGIQSFGDLLNNPKTDDTTGWTASTRELTLSMTGIYGGTVERNIPGDYMSEGFYKFWGPQCYNLDWASGRADFDSVDISQANTLEFDFFVSDLDGVKGLEYVDTKNTDDPADDETRSFVSFFLRLFSPNGFQTINFGGEIVKSGWTHVSVPLSYVNGEGEFDPTDITALGFYMEPIFAQCTPDKNYAFGLLNLTAVGDPGDAEDPGIGDFGPAVPGPDSGPYAQSTAKAVLYAKGDGSEGNIYYPGGQAEAAMTFSAANASMPQLNNYFIRPGGRYLADCDAITFELELSSQAAYDEWKNHMTFGIQDSAGVWFTWPMPADLKEGVNTVTLDLRPAAQNGVNLKRVSQFGIQTFGDLQNAPKTNTADGWTGSTRDLTLSITDVYGCTMERAIPGTYIHNGFYRFWGPLCGSLDWAVTQLYFEGVDISEARALEFDFYVDDLDSLKALKFVDKKGNEDPSDDVAGSFATFNLRLFSLNGNSTIDFGSQITKSGWNHVKVPLSFVSSEGDFDLAAVNGFAFYMEPNLYSCTPDKNYVFGLLNLSAEYPPPPYVGPENPNSPLKPDTGAYYISSCESLTDGGVWSPAELTLDTRTKSEGTASISVTLKDQPLRGNSIRVYTTQSFDVSNAKDLKFDLFVSDLAMLREKTSLAVRLNSDARGTSDYIQWPLDTAALKEGWNSIAVSLADAVKTGDFDAKAACGFYLLCTEAGFEGDESVVLKLDNVRVTGSAGGSTAPGGPEDPENPENPEDPVIPGTGVAAEAALPVTLGGLALLGLLASRGKRGKKMV